MILKYLLIVTSTVCFLLFALGIYRLTKENEPNLCQMTYMYKNPQFTKVPMKKNFEGYNLYYYNEGNERPDLKALNGAPVLFVPGNGGSYKQARSLGSVALRMGMGYNKPHLDYFTIDINEELTALYGGYLSRQHRFLKQCINSILRLYKAQDKSVKRKIVLVGHSMGGVVSKSMLNEADWLKKIAIIIFISSPLDRPVIYADKEIDNFYKQTDNRLLIDNDELLADDETSLGLGKNATNIPDVVLISIGGGSRDNLVPAPLTASRLSDVHVISTAIPNVWVTCDHLAAMWCLQLMKVINKFLYDITFKAAEGFTFFSTNALLNLQAAQHYFIGAQGDATHKDLSEFSAENWTATRTLSFYKVFENGIQSNYQQAIFYEDVAPYEEIYVAVTHETQNHQWLFGCQHNNCVENQMLSQQIMTLPSKRGHKSFVLLNLAAIFGTFSNWTHLLIRLDATKHYAALYIDVHNAEERVFNLKAPHWFEFMPKNLNLTTKMQMFKKLQIRDLTDSFYAFKLKFDFAVAEPTHRNNYETIIRIYAPWAAGFDRYYTLTAAQIVSHDVLIQLPKDALNATKPFLYVDVHTDPWCTFNISYRFSLVDSVRNLVQLYYHWLPAHMALIIISCLGGQFRSSLNVNKYADFLQLKSWYFVVVVRFATNIVTLLPFFPKELLQNPAKHFSCYASLIVHGFAMACCVVIAQTVRLNLRIFTKLFSKVSIPEISIPKLHIIFAVIFACISISCSKCISLASMLFIYTILIAIANKVDTNQGSTTPSIHNDKFDNSDDENKEQVDLAHTADDTERDIDKINKISSNEGFKNLDYHVALWVLISLMIIVNVGDTIAWFKSIFDHYSYHSIQSLTSLLFTPVIFVICFLPLLWHLNAPFHVESTPIYALILNTTAAMSLLLCEEKLYRLNYVIAFVVALLVFRELLKKKP